MSPASDKFAQIFTSQHDKIILGYPQRVQWLGDSLELIPLGLVQPQIPVILPEPSPDRNLNAAFGAYPPCHQPFP